MDYQTLVAFSESLHILAESNQDLEKEINQFKRANGIDEPQQLASACQALQDQNRLMNIGIVGRVKAGKSSLLNALVFDGESILPKAATPMTAALTTITWGEAFQAQVEFYSETDIAVISAKANEFERRLAVRATECLEELIKRRRDQDAGASVDTVQLKAMADKKALSQLQRQEGFFAAYDQYQRMNASGVDIAALHAYSEIQASNPKELAEQLHGYVGVQGKFMPFTKSVHVAMPVETLRDICIVDTPGLNDPVQSREERTVELLKMCDVVFIVSPAGQFLNEQDLEVMGRITQKEGVQELVLVASQVDTQLYGSEKRARLSEALDIIRQQLSARARSALTDLKRSSPEVGSVFDNLIASVDRNLLHSSGLCHSLSRRFESTQSWDSNEQVTWENLTTHYPDYFAGENRELSVHSLDSLANIDAIKEMLAQVREKKADITRDKMSSLLGRKLKSLQEFRALIIELARNRIGQIKSADREQLKKQLALLESKCAKLSLELDSEFNYVMADYRHRLRGAMRETAARLLRETEGGVEKAQGSYSETITENKTGFGNWIARLWGGGTTERTVVRAKIISGQVISALKGFMSDIQDELRRDVENSRRLLDEELARTLMPTIRKALEEEADGMMIRQAIVSTIQELPNDDFVLNISLPESLKSRGTLKGYEAEQFKDDADDFISSLGSKVKSKTSSYIRDVEGRAPTTISGFFVEEIQDRINGLMEQVDHAEQNVDRLERLMRKAEEVSL